MTTTTITMMMIMVSEPQLVLRISCEINTIISPASEGYPSSLIPQVIISKTEGNYQHDTYAIPDEESEFTRLGFDG